MEDHPKLQSLCATLAAISDPEQVRALWDDLCTRKELDNMAERLSRCVRYGKGYVRLKELTVDN